ncbi:hypothetical protein PG987_008044 [Apiospora arundinis]
MRASVALAIPSFAVAISWSAMILNERSTSNTPLLDPRKGCSGQRQSGDKSSGQRLGPNDSFHNCKLKDGKWCAKNKDGSGALDATKGQGREDYGFCFTGKCKA